MRSFVNQIIGLSVLVLAASQGAQAFPLKASTPAVAPETANFLDIVPASGVDFTAIVSLSGCSGSLVRFENSLGIDRAMVLTNGHCKEGGMPSPGQVFVNTASSRSFTLLKSDASGSITTLKADQILLSTMTGTDMTLYRLTSTFDDIEKRFGVRALTIQSKHPEASRKIAVVSGYWKRIYNCAIDGFAYRLKEDNWTMNDSVRYSKPGCEVIGGTSGSPVIDTETHAVVAVNNTINEDGERCTMDNPCEVDERGNVTYSKGTGYAQEIYWIYSCLNSANQLDFNQAGCKKPF